MPGSPTTTDHDERLILAAARESADRAMTPHGASTYALTARSARLADTTLLVPADDHQHLAALLAAVANDAIHRYRRSAAAVQHADQIGQHLDVVA